MLALELLIVSRGYAIKALVLDSAQAGHWLPAASAAWRPAAGRSGACPPLALAHRPPQSKESGVEWIATVRSSAAPASSGWGTEGEEETDTDNCESCEGPARAADAADPADGPRRSIE